MKHTEDNFHRLSFGSNKVMKQYHLFCVLLIFLSTWKFSPSGVSGIIVAEANWFAKLPKFLFNRNNNNNLATLLKQKELESSIRTLKDEISQMKRQVVLYKQNVNSLRKERIELKKHYENVLKDLDKKHQEELSKIKSSLIEQYKEDNEMLLQTLRDNFELEKQDLLEELEKLHQEEKQELKQEILQLKSTSADAVKTVEDLKVQLKSSQDDNEKKTKEFEKREGDYAKVRYCYYHL